MINVSACVIANYVGSERTYAHGISIYVPKAMAILGLPFLIVLERYNSDYDALDFSRAAYWNGFMGSYFGLFGNRINLSPSYYTNVNPGSSVQFNVHVSLESGSPDWVDLNIRAISPELQATWSFSQSSGRPPFDST